MVLGIVHAQLDELEARRAQVIQFPRQKSKIRGEFAQGAA